MTPTFAPDSAVTPPTTLPVSGCSAPWPLPPLDHAMAAEGHFDELRGLAAATPDHGPAPAWRTFFQSLPDTSPETLDRHHARLQRLIRDNGTSYTAQGDAPAELRPWELNLFPLLLSHAEWQGLATGIQQRMRLLEQVMADVYGPQTLMQQGWLPPALIQGHPGYLRPMHGIAQQRYLHIAAFDMIRDSRGLWWLMAQRTQAPSGLGYLIENRHIIRQLFPDGFNQLQTATITGVYRGFLQALHQQCQQLAEGDEPLTLVLLTSGPWSKTWFEQAYLARYLGLTLVQASDLTVRDNRLYLKTLQGLVRVHGMLRRVDDSWMDALELRPESREGVPGLLQVMRDGQVVVANSPGSSFLESPALQGFLPPLARHLLGESLQIPSLPTWWCGEAAALQGVEQRLQDFAIKPTYSGSELHDSFPTRLGRQLNAQELQQLQADMRRQGDDFTVQQYAPLSQMPGWSRGDDTGSGRMEMRSLVLRLFALSDGAGWSVLPGGMARLAAGTDPFTSMQSGGSSADVWITGWPATPEPSPPPPRQDAEAEHIVSRTAENLFWLGRYTERAENAVRLQLLVLDSLQQLDRPGPALRQWLQQLLQDQQLAPCDPAPAVDLPGEQLSRLLVQQWQLPDCAAQGNVKALARTAAELRSQLPHQHWHLVQSVERHMQALRLENQQADAPITSSMDMDSQLRQLSHALAAVTGVQLDRLQRDAGWQLLMLGRWIERLSFVAGSLLPASASSTPLDRQAASTIMALFDQHLQQPRMQALGPPTAEAWHTLTGSPCHPRSLHWVLEQIRNALQALPPLPFSPEVVEPVPFPQQISQLQERLKTPAAAPSDSAEALRQCVELAIALTDNITRSYFDPVDHASRSVGA